MASTRRNSPTIAQQKRSQNDQTDLPDVCFDNGHEGELRTPITKAFPTTEAKRVSATATSI